MKRRDFLAGILGALAVGRAGVPDRLSPRLKPLAARQIPLGAQLYTVRESMAADPGRTLAAIAEIGYAEVELAGLHGLAAAEMRGLLDAEGLRAPSSHEGTERIESDWEGALDDAVTLGQRWIVCPYLGTGYRGPDGYRRAAELFNSAGERAQAAGLGFAYHNHDFEFEPLPDGTTGYDVLLSRCDPALVSMQMDVFWIVHAGEDPLTHLNRNPGRFTSVHLKDRAPDGSMVTVGDGSIPFDRLLPAFSAAGTAHFFVEHDQPEDGLEVLRASHDHLRRIRP